MGAVAAPVWLANPTPCALTTPRTPLRPPHPAPPCPVRHGHGSSMVLAS